MVRALVGCIIITFLGEQKGGEKTEKKRIRNATLAESRIAVWLNWKRVRQRDRVRRMVILAELETEAETETERERENERKRKLTTRVEIGKPS